MGLRRVVDQHLAVVINNLRKEHRLCVDAAVGDSGIGRRHLQVGHAVGDSAQGQSRVVVRIGQRCDAEVLRVFHTELRCNGLHQTADRNDVHGIDDTVPDAGIALITGAVPVGEGLLANRENRIVIDSTQRRAARIHGGGKRSQHLEGGTGLTKGVAGTV